MNTPEGTGYKLNKLQPGTDKSKCMPFNGEFESHPKAGTLEMHNQHNAKSIQRIYELKHKTNNEIYTLDLLTKTSCSQNISAPA